MRGGMSEHERPQGERGAKRAGWLALAPAGRSEERTPSEHERPQGERGAKRAGWLAAPREGADMGGAPASRSEKRTPSGRTGRHEGGRCG